MRTFKTIGILAVAGLLFMSFGQNKKETKGEQTPETIQSTIAELESSNIVEVAAGNDNFSTLVAAVKAASLVETLGGDGPFTVFAPTNDAFEKLPDGTVESLLLPENKDALTKILTYHVVSGKFEAAAVIDAINANNGKFTVSTLQGGTIDLSLKGDNVILTDSKGGMSTVVIADVQASNGVIHALDTVVMPE